MRSSLVSSRFSFALSVDPRGSEPAFWRALGGMPYTSLPITTLLTCTCGDAVRKLADEMARDTEGLRMEIDVISDVSSLETDSSHELVLDIVKSVRSVRGADPEVGGVAYATDGAHLGPGFNMPVVICGPGAPGMAHQPDEYVETQQLTEAAEIYMDLALRTL